MSCANMLVKCKLTHIFYKGIIIVALKRVSIHQTLLFESSIPQQLEYIPTIMHTVHALSCFVVVWYWPISPISFRVTSLALGQSYDCPSASEVTLKVNISNESKTTDITTTKQSTTKKPVHVLWGILYVCMYSYWGFPAIWCIDQYGSGQTSLCIH